MLTTQHQHLRVALTIGAAAIAAVVAGCGGGGDGDGTADRLSCASACKPSSTLATDQIRASYAIVSDEQKVQARAGFSAGSDPRFNVELEGGDTVRLASSQGTQPFYIPAPQSLVGDVFVTLIFGAGSYLSDVTRPAGTAAMPFQFQLVRGATVYSSTVMLPAPFQFTSPAAGVVLPITTRALPVRLTAANASPLNTATLNCTDANGNTASSTNGNVNIVPGSLSSDANGTAYTVDLGAAIDVLTFTATNPRGAIARCDIVVQASIRADGQPDAHLATSKIVGQQNRSVSFALR